MHRRGSSEVQAFQSVFSMIVTALQDFVELSETIDSFSIVVLLLLLSLGSRKNDNSAGQA